jgi:hypothetical protein
MKNLKSVFLCLFVLLIVQCTCTMRPIEEEYEMVSLFNNSEKRGSFIIGTGSIEEEEYFYIFVKEHDGALSRMNFPANRVKIYEGYETARVKYKTGGHEPYIYYRDVRMYVPKNTVVRQLKVK